MGRREQPIDPMAGPLQAFAFDLRMLRTKAGEPSYRKLAPRAGFSASSLAAAASGVALPSRQVSLAYVAACGGDIAEWSQRWDALCVQQDQPEIATDRWVLPALDIDERRLALVEAVWQQWIQDTLRCAVEASGLIAPRLTGGDGRPSDITGLASSLPRVRRVVIVGPPSIGKTVASLALARELIVAGASLVPVVIPLLPESAPRAAQHPHDWLCDEIAHQHGISMAAVRSLLDSGQLLPVLDGLDSLPEKARAVAAKAINALDPCVITCRTGLYETLAPDLGPHETVTVQPLSVLQVQQHLPFVPGPDLIELLTVPAFLNTALRLPRPGTVDRTSVCEAYINATPLSRPTHRALHWLSSIALFGTFDPRRPRVDLLSRRRHRRLVTGGIPAAVTAVVLAGIACTSLLAARWWYETDEGLTATLAAGLTAAVLCLAGVVCETYLRRALVLRLLVRQEALPHDIVGFLRNAHCAALLDETRDGYHFAHPYLQQHFLRKSSAPAPQTASTRKDLESVQIRRSTLTYIECEQTIL